MPVHVYEVDRSEVKQIEKLMKYDPYLDPNLIPKSKEDKSGKTDPAVAEAIKKLREDRFANVIYARHECEIKEGRYLGIEGEKFYFYVSAPEEFLALSDEKLSKEFKTVKRAPPEIEQKYIKIKQEEEEKSNAGFGAIFG
jgi:hypothetical protein